MTADALPLSAIPKLEEIKLSSNKSGPKLYMVRLDRVFALASGNKLYKLQGFIETARQSGIRQLLSFGGAYSNHIHALALTAQYFDMESIGIIRGEASAIKNPTLSDAIAAGMQLSFVSRKIYRQRFDSGYLQKLQQCYPRALIIPEGGAHPAALKGCSQIPRLLNQQMPQSIDCFCCAVGTGTTLAGLVLGVQPEQSVLGYQVVRDTSVSIRLQQLLSDQHFSCEPVIVAADFGGYAKVDKPLLDFILHWYEETGILLDPVYTGKLCFRLVRQLAQSYFRSDQTLAIIHTGGLQGWRGMRDRVIKLGGTQSWCTIEQAMKA